MAEVDAIVELTGVRFSWPGTAQPVLQIDELMLGKGERVFLYGPSGSGKSTLLSIIAAVIKPQSGTVRVGGVDLCTLAGAATDRFRADHIGLIFQQFNLLPFLSVLENVQLPCRFSTARRTRAVEKGNSLEQEAARLLRSMQLPENLHASRSAMHLSVGQQQRVAVARALMGRPSLVIADEPTSSLDTDARDAFLELLFAELADTGASLLFVSHDESLRSRFDRSLALADLNCTDKTGTPEQS